MKRTRRTTLLLIFALALPGMAEISDHLPPVPPDPPPAGPFAAGEREELLKDYVSKVQDIGNVAISLTNFGFIGDNFADRDVPSMVFPKGSAIDHLIRAGIWVGGINTNLDQLVTTGVEDGYYGTHSRSTEWEPGGILPEEINTHPRRRILCLNYYPLLGD